MPLGVTPYVHARYLALQGVPSQHWWLDLADAQRTRNAWRLDYTNHRPHSSVGGRSRADLRVGGHFTRDRIGCKTLASSDPIGERTIGLSA